MAGKSSSSSGGIGLLGAFALLFVALKLLGYIDWSWWWVLAPVWIPISVAVVVMVIVGAVLLHNR